MAPTKLSLADYIKNIEYVAAYMTDGQGRITLWNSSIECLLGYSEHDVMGKHDSLLLHDTSEPPIAKGPRFSWRKAKDGSLHFVLETVSIIKDPESEDFHTMKIIEDYTKDVSFFDKIDLWMQQYQSQDLILVASQEKMTLQQVSEKFAHVFGYSAAELQGVHIDSILHRQESESCSGSSQEIVVSSKRIYGLRFLHKNRSISRATLNAFEIGNLNSEGVSEIYWFAKVVPTEIQDAKLTEYFF